MRSKTTIALAALALAGLASPAEAHRRTAYGPVCNPGNVNIKSTTCYFCNPNGDCSHKALDICVFNPCGSCNNDNVKGMLENSTHYVWHGGCADDCNGSNCNGGAGNYYTVTGSDGYEFRELHLNSSAASGTKTCDRCNLGKLGSTGSSTAPHVHADNRRNGERLTAWYNITDTTCGDPAGCGVIVGKPRMHAEP